MYTELLTPTSGIQIAQSKCAQAPLLVCLYAPPSFGQKMQSYGEGRVSGGGKGAK